MAFFACTLLQGCASQSHFSSSFPKRLTETQNLWRFRAPAHGPSVPPPAGAPGPLVDGASLQQMMNQLVYVSPLRGYPVQVAVIPDDKINARTDGMTIYLNSGLLNAFSGHESLVASVLAHELGHILANHQPEGKARTSSLSYLGYLTPALGALPYGGLYGGLASTAIQQGIQIRQYSYDRLQENEADVIGVLIASEAGYDAMGLCQFFDYAGTHFFSKPKTVSIPTSVSAIPESVAVTLLSTSPLYRTHPASDKRKKIVELVLQRKKGSLTQAQLRKESRWAAAIYEQLERARPKSKN